MANGKSCLQTMTGYKDSAGGCGTPWRGAGQWREVPHILFSALFSQPLRWLGKFLAVIYPILTLQLAGLPLLIHFPRHFSYCHALVASKQPVGLGRGAAAAPALPEETFPAYQHFLTTGNGSGESWGK